MRPDRVSIFEVGPRDGLQNEVQVSTKDKIRLIDDLTLAGVTRIETGSFVSPKWVPQMADSDAVFAGINRQAQVRYSALTPNMQGLDAAITAGADEVAVFASASEGFSQRNINCSVEESIARFIPLVDKANTLGLPVRGYVSCTLGCPYDGDIALTEVVRVCDILYRLGVYEISLGDTIGIGTADQARRMVEAVSSKVPMEQLALHFHDTRGQALANILACLDLGIGTIDSSVAGLGGCPYAKGASGNLATEDLVYMLHGLGIDTGINLPALARAGDTISAAIGKPSGAKTALALSH
ncbi:hydroxymethylglutaryl-CoA lyase [Shewanella sp. NFH-SH190041]|uniref:hydroxymethylglutaryl-CoA lyase n=1 Tax=Shewanella sp. NFH-SH190041 TaxID=2950245 RepID=UPI0021C29387|nr:hydroxymethylglutaryl-CoA lyase [Shewanella sp. NFH-SH190041]BDM65149.1 hydroxymethylglutaryl-CoA lyase [Shewanella sp. NFH-SH190041]